MNKQPNKQLGHPAVGGTGGTISGLPENLPADQAGDDIQNDPANKPGSENSLGQRPNNREGDSEFLLPGKLYKAKPQGFLSLAEAAKLTGYHQDYLGQLARSGKLEATKIGRNWVTTQAGIEKLIAETTGQVVLGGDLPELAKIREISPTPEPVSTPASQPEIPVRRSLFRRALLPASIGLISLVLLGSIAAGLFYFTSGQFSKINDALASLQQLVLNQTGGKGGNSADAGEVLGTSTYQLGSKSAPAKITLSPTQIFNAVHDFFLSPISNDIKQLFVGPPGSAGEPGPTGPPGPALSYIPNSGSVFNITAPTAEPSNVGTIGSATYFSSKELYTNTLSVTSDITQTGGSTTLRDTTISGDLTVTGNVDLSADSIGPLEIDDTGDVPADEECLTYEATGPVFEWQTCSPGATSLQEAYNTTTIGLIETDGTNSILFTETTTGAVTADLLQLTVNQAAGGTFSGDALQITQDGFDADAFTGIGLHIVVDQSQNSGSLILAEDDAGTDLFLLSENGAITVSAAGAETTAITITDTDFTNSLSIADNDITGTTFDIIGTDAVINFADFDVIAEGFTTIAPDTDGTALTLTQSLTTGQSEDINLTLSDDGDVDTVTALNIDVTSADVDDADILYGINIGNLASADVDASERALRIGSGWDAAIDVNGTLLSLTELALLDGRSGTLVDSANVATYATTGVTAGAGLVTGGTVGVVTVDVGAGACVTVNANDVAVTADCIGDTQLAFNTGQHLTTTSSPTFTALTLLGAEAGDAVLTLDADEGDDATDTWLIKSLATGNSLSFLNDVTEVANLTSAGALQLDSLAGGGTLCVQTDNNGLISAAAAACGSGSSSLQGAYDTATIGLIETDATNPILFTETTGGGGAHAADLLQLTVNQATGASFSGDILQITQDGFDADAFTGIGLHIVVDQSQNSGSLILAEDDAGTDLFLLSENGAITVSAAGAETTAITITDTDFTNALSIADNDITGTTFDIIGTDAVINFTDFDVIAEGFMTIAPDSAGDAITINNGDGDIQALVVDATTTDLTSTAGLIDLNVDTSTNLVVGGQYLTLTVIADAGNDSIYGNETSVTINTDADGSDSVYANAIFLNNNDANSTGIGSYISVQSIGGDVGLDILFTQNDDGDATDTSYGELILMTNKSGDAGDKLYGLSITNADDAANQITDALIKLDNAEDTAATVPDGILITSSGVNEGITDAIDVSATNILNSINIGANPIVTGNVAGTIGDSTTDSWTFLTDGTGDGEIVLPDDSIGVAEINDTGDAPGDEECLTYEATGTQFQWETCGGATAFDDIGDPDAATTIAFDDTETVLLQTASDGENFLTIDLTDATLTGTTRGLVIQTADNDDANFVPFTILDDSGGTPDTLFNIGSSGLITTASVDSASLADDDWGDVSITSGVATVQDLTCTDCINATEIEDIYLLNSGDTSTGDITIAKIDPSLVLTPPGSDTDFWLGVTDDGGNDDDDFFQIGDGSTPGTNPFFTIDTAGNVGIGDPSPDSILNIIGTTTGNGATAVAGILTELTLSNAATDGAFQYGNRSIVTVSSASGVDANYIGQFIRMIDDDCTPTDCINTVRGLEVQAYSGTNNAGINTGIATFGKTFGIQAETTAQAGSVSQAAAVFADLNNSNDGSLGNAIRAFSNDITSANLVFLNQKTSVFTGTALYMNLADGAGTFSGQFADFQKNAVSKFKVDDTGVVSLNLSGTETTNGLCHSGADVDAGTDTLRDVVACSAAPGDIAEWYETESDVEAGDVVMTTANSFAFTEGLFDPFTGMGTGINASRRISILGKAISDNSGSVIGVVSTSPYQTFGDAVRNDQGQNPQPIALSGRVPVKISEENGPIHIGDKLTLSAERAGYAAKMTRSGASIGIALEGSAGDAQGLGMIMVMVNLGYDRIDIALNSEDNSIILDSNLDLSGMALLNVKTINTLADNWSIDENGVLIAREIKTEKLCLGQTCVDESTLKALLQNVGLGNQESSGGGSGTVSGTTSTEPEPTSSESSTDPGSTEPAAPDDDSTAITPTDSVGADATVTDTSTAPTAEETSDTSTAPTTETVSPPAPEPVSTVSSDPVP